MQLDVESDNTLPFNASNYLLSFETMQDRRDWGLTSPLFITRGMYVFFNLASLVSGYNADPMEYHVPSLDDDNPHKSFS